MAKLQANLICTCGHSKNDHSTHIFDMFPIAVPFEFCSLCDAKIGHIHNFKTDNIKYLEECYKEYKNA